MRPRKAETSGTDDLLRSRLDQIIDMKHELVRLADAIDWDWLDDEIADTTVQPKNVTHPTDAKLMLTAIEQLGKQARAHGVPLRQSYVRVAKWAALMAGRYAHAKQFKRCNRELSTL